MPPTCRRAGALLLAAWLLLTACGTGERPTLAEVGAENAPEPVELDLPPAPDTVPPLAPTDPEFPLESSVDDALLAWALDRQVPYLDSCSRITPAPGQLCDTATELDTVRLLGPSGQETWYIVTVLEAFKPATGRGYRVSNVQIAGR